MKPVDRSRPYDATGFSTRACCETLTRSPMRWASSLREKDRCPSIDLKYADEPGRGPDHTRSRPSPPQPNARSSLRRNVGMGPSSAKGASAHDRRSSSINSPASSARASVRVESAWCTSTAVANSCRRTQRGRRPIGPELAVARPSTEMVTDSPDPTRFHTAHCELRRSREASSVMAQI